MWARIEENRVLEVTDIDPSGRFHPSIVWYNVPEGTGAGMIQNGESFEWPPAPEPIQVSVITRRQGRLALRRADKLASVETAIAAIEDEDERIDAQIEYEADTWELDNPFLQSMWAELEGTEQELKDLFTLANTL